MRKLVSTLCAYAYYAQVFMPCVCVDYSRAAVKAPAREMKGVFVARHGT